MFAFSEKQYVCSCEEQKPIGDIQHDNLETRSTDAFTLHAMTLLAFDLQNSHSVNPNHISDIYTGCIESAGMTGTALHDKVFK